MIPSIDEASIQQHKSYTYFHDLQETKQRVVVGIDEAGRGPVIGPMVYGAAFVPIAEADALVQTGFADSKTLTAEVRERLVERIMEEKRVGWTVGVLSARDISAAMLAPAPTNLNAQALTATLDLLHAIAAKHELVEVYVDTLGPPSQHQAKLARVFPQAQITVSKKADSIWPIVGAASICAKVTRDAVLAAMPHDGDWGSGYPSDPRSSDWLKQHRDPVFGWTPDVRFSWQTAALEGVDWEKDDPSIKTPQPLYTTVSLDDL